MHSKRGVVAPWNSGHFRIEIYTSTRYIDKSKLCQKPLQCFLFSLQPKTACAAQESLQVQMTLPVSSFRIRWTNVFRWDPPSAQIKNKILSRKKIKETKVRVDSSMSKANKSSFNDSSVLHYLVSYEINLDKIKYRINLVKLGLNLIEDWNKCTIKLTFLDPLYLFYCLIDARI